MLHSRRVRRAVTSALIVLVMPAALSFAPSAAAAQERPDFQLPFPCGQSWRLDSWGHAPAIDMVREPNQEGTEGSQLIAPADGVVVESFRHDNAGEVIQIDHGGNWFTTYLHLQSRSVDVGDEVDRGDGIGRVGRSGPTANNHPHLHFELAVDDNGDGSASWGFEGSERVRPWFDGVEYGQANNRTWRNVESGNCADTAQATRTTTTTTVPETTTTTEQATTTTAPETTTTEPETTTTTMQATTTTVEATGTESASGDTLPRTGTSTTAIATALAAALLAFGAVLVLIRRHLAR
jgi:LPXTG-motif cell wall-anchored protein